MDTFPFSDVHRGLTRSCPSQLRHFWKERMVVSLTCRKERYHIVTFIFLFCLNTVNLMKELLGFLKLPEPSTSSVKKCKVILTKAVDLSRNCNFTNFSSRLHVSRYFWRRVFFFSVLAFRPDLNGVFGSQKRRFSKAFPKVDVCQYDDVMVCGTSSPN